MPRRFGSASLSMVGRAQVLDCQAAVHYDEGERFGMAASSWSDWDTDTWEVEPNTREFTGSDGLSWWSEGGVLRGCGNTVNFQVIPQMSDEYGDVSISISFDWQGNLTTNTCTVTNAPSDIKCDEEPGVSPITYRVHSTKFP